MSDKKLLIFTGVGDNEDQFLSWAYKHNYTFDRAVNYYGHNLERLNLLKSKEIEFIYQNKGMIWENFYQHFKDYSNYDYYLIVDSDLSLNPDHIEISLDYVMQNNVHGATWSRTADSCGYFTPLFLSRETDNTTYCSNWMEMSFMLMSHRLTEKTIDKWKELDLTWSTGIDHVVSNVAAENNLLPFRIFNNFLFRNPHPSEKKNGREIDYITNSNTEQRLSEVLQKIDNDIFFQIKPEDISVWEVKKVLITGNSGYIGSHLTQLLNKRSDLVLYGLDKDPVKIPINKFSNKNIIEESHIWPYQEVEFDCVIHLAAEVAVGRSVLDPTLYYLTNTLGTLNVLKNLKYKNFVFASTGAAAGLGSPYGISKRMAEDIVKQYCESNQTPFTIFRFYNVTGSDGIDPTNTDGLFFNLIKAKETGLFRLFGDDYNTRDGSAERDYTHVNEICAAVEKAIDGSSNQIENLGHGVGTTVKEMIRIFKEVNDCDFDVIIDGRRAGDLERSVLDNPSKYMKKRYSIKDLLLMSKDHHE